MPLMSLQGNSPILKKKIENPNLMLIYLKGMTLLTFAMRGKAIIYYRTTLYSTVKPPHHPLSGLLGDYKENPNLY